ncbi:MAG TPA: hypothetical protein VMW83_07555 [Spirochaetia bacterium]|nr:hypothetical protein [Spirochaetia bacterium]
MDLYENLVSVLLGHKGYFYLPQVDIHKGTGPNGRLACLDFVALNFADEEIYLIEVTKQGQEKNATKKINPADYPDVENYVKNYTLHGNSNNYKMTWWAMPDKPLR